MDVCAHSFDNIVILNVHLIVPEVATSQDSTPLNKNQWELRPTIFLPKREAKKEEEMEEEEGHLPGRCCSPSTVFFRGKGQRVQREGTPADCNH